MGFIFKDLQDKHVLITGGTGGIGAGLTPAFARQGCRVSIVGRDAAKGQALADQCNAEGGKVYYYQVDVTITDQLVSVLAKAQNDHGTVNVLINNAGYDPRYDVLQMTEAQWDDLFKLNVGHYFITCRELIPGMIDAGGGSIIMTTSCMHWIAFPDLTAYTATKSAIIGMVRSLARSVGKHHIRVNAIAPGWVMTERQLREMVTPEIKEKLFNEFQILPIYLTPEDLAPSYLFLASDAAKPITRQTLVVDAGYAMS
jgi:NAD(P)-dependent dehydrogenase (short-subunit alcohol dehydrogenase family)